MIKKSLIGMAVAGLALTACQSQVSASATGNVNAHGNASTTSNVSLSATTTTPICSTTNLRISFGRPAATGRTQQYRVRVLLLNHGPATCHMNGYPGMDLVGDGGDIRLHVPRQAASHDTVRLAPGRSASFTLTYLLENDQQIQGELGAWGPNRVVITAPGATTQQTLKWTLGPVDRFSTTPGHGTTLSPVRPG